jgi:hypothetical protein
VNRLLGRNNDVCVFRGDATPPRRVHDCAMNTGVDSSRQQNPLVGCQVFEHDVLFFSSRVGL